MYIYQLEFLFKRQSILSAILRVSRIIWTFLESFYSLWYWFVQRDIKSQYQNCYRCKKKKKKMSGAILIHRIVFLSISLICICKWLRLRTCKYYIVTQDIIPKWNVSFQEYLSRCSLLFRHLVWVFEPVLAQNPHYDRQCP